MYTNLAIDFGIGLIPVLGDIADAWFKCNTRNNMLLERYLRERGQKFPVPPTTTPPKQSGFTLKKLFGQDATNHDARQNVSDPQGDSMGGNGGSGVVDPTERDLEG